MVLRSLKGSVTQMGPLKRNEPRPSEQNSVPKELYIQNSKQPGILPSVPHRCPMDSTLHMRNVCSVDSLKIHRENYNIPHPTARPSTCTSCPFPSIITKTTTTLENPIY